MTVLDTVTAFCADHGEEVFVPEDDEEYGFDWTTTLDGNFQRHVVVADEDGVFFEAGQIGEGPKFSGHVDPESVVYEDAVLKFDVKVYSGVMHCTICSVEGAPGFLLQAYSQASEVEA